MGCDVSKHVANHSRVRDISMIGAEEDYVPRQILCVLTLLLMAAASAWSKESPLQIKVLSAESRIFEGPPIAPPDCNWRDISAYCTSSKPESYVENKMAVQEPDGKTLEIACTVYNQWSHCASLPVNQTFKARIVKNGVEIWFKDQRGKLRKQVYEVLSQNEESRHK